MSRSLNARGPGRAGLVELAQQLSPRDTQVLDELRRHRFLRTDHLTHLVFTRHRSPSTAARVCRTVLGRLHSRRLIHALPRRVGGLQGGAAHTVWQLTTVGQRLLQQLAGETRGNRIGEVGQLFMHHYLAIADVHCRLRAAERSGRFDLLELTLEPDNWRTFTDSAGVTQVLKPDLYAVTATADYEDHWFIEVDRGTENMPTLLRQCQAYARYRKNGTEQAATGVFPRVIWLVPTARRVEKLIDAIGNARHLERGLFYALLTPDQLVDFVAGGAS